MPPKRGKSASVNNNEWEKGLTTAQLNENGWNMHLTLLVPTSFDDYTNLDAIAEWSRTGKPIRRLFQIFNYDDLLKQVNEFGNQKGKKPKDVPQFYEVCEVAKPLLDNGEELPALLIAKLIKFKLLQIKQADQKRREAEKLAAESGDGGKGKAKKAVPDKKTPAKKDAGKDAGKGKKRDDDQDKYVDDEPEDGAQQYVLFYNFHNPYLLPLLDDLGCHVDCLLRTTSKPASAASDEAGSVPVSERSAKLDVTPEANLTAEQKAALERQQRREKVNERLFVFWRDVRLILQQASLQSKLYDLPILEYEFKGSPVAREGVDEKAARLQFGQTAFDDVASLAYNLLELKRQFQHYRASMRLLHVPACEPARATSAPSQLDGSQSARDCAIDSDLPLLDMRHYEELLCGVPDESASVELILHCMLEQVSVAALDSCPQDVQGPRETANSAADTLSDYLSSKLAPLDTRGVDRHHFVHPKDGTRQRTLTLNGSLSFDPLAAELRMLRMQEPFRSALQHCEESEESEDERKQLQYRARLQQLLHLCEKRDLSSLTVDRALRQFLLECVPLSRTDEHDTLPDDVLHALCKQHAYESVWNDPDSVAKYMRTEEAIGSDLSVDELLQAVSAEHKRNLDEWHFSERLDADVLLQTLRDAHYTLQTVETLPERRSDNLLIVLHNAFDDRTKQNRQEWQCWLHCDCGFRNYLEHVTQYVADWTRKEEVLYAARRAQLALERQRAQQAAEQARAMSETRSVDKNDKKTSRNNSKPARTSRGGSRASSTSSVRAGAEDEKTSPRLARGRTSNRTRSTSGLVSSNTDKSSLPPAPPPLYTYPQAHELPFMGYDMHDRLVHATGSATNMFPSDGGVVAVERTDFLHGSVLVRATVKKDGHVLAVHVADPVKTTLSRFQQTFAGFVSNDDPQTLQLVPETLAASFFASFTAQLADGVAVALSTYGPDGTPGGLARPAPAPPAVPTPPPQPEPPAEQDPKKISPRSKAIKRKQSAEKDKDPPPEEVAPASTQTTARSANSAIDQEPVQKGDPLQQVWLSTPSGVLVTYKVEGVESLQTSDGEPLTRNKLLVELGLASNANGGTDENKRRTVRSDGSVVCVSSDGLLQVLFADGTVSMHCSYDYLVRCTTLLESDAVPPELQALLDSPKLGAPPKLTCWVTTAPSGRRVATVGNEQCGVWCELRVRDAVVLHANDATTGNTLLTRDDSVSVLLQPDGKTVALHADGTCITQDPACPVIDQLARGVSGEFRTPVSEKHPVVLVEHPRYPTIQFDTASGVCKTEFASGTEVQLTPDGLYHLRTANDGHLVIDQSGSVQYIPHVHSLTTYAAQRRKCAYSFTMNRDVVCTVEDDDCNLFSVSVDGQCSVTPASARPITAQNSESPWNAPARPSDSGITYYRQHHPRFFAVDRLGAGVELLRYQDVAEYLVAAESNPQAAVIREKLHGGPSECITIVKPVPRTLHEVWSSREYRLRPLPPASLRARDLRPLAHAEMQAAELRLQLAAAVRGAPPSAPVNGPGPELAARPDTDGHICPSEQADMLRERRLVPRVFELRQLMQFEPLDGTVRSYLFEGLREYLVQLEQRALQQHLMRFDELRSSDEMASAVIRTRVAQPLPDAEADADAEEGDSLPTSRRPKPDRPHNLSPPPSDTEAEANADADADADAVQSGSAHRCGCSLPLGQSVCAEKCSAVCQPGLCAVQTAPPEIPDLDALAARLARLQRRGIADRMGLADSPTLKMSSHITQLPALPQPTQTPPQSVATSPPSGANSSLLCATSAQHSANKCKACASFAHCDHLCDPHLFVDAAGLNRKVPVRPPAYLNGGRPNAVPNLKFLNVDESTRSKVNMACFAGLPVDRQERLKKMRGFELLPTEVDFGVVCEGKMYVTSVLLKNVGMDTCHFRIKQPPPSTGLRVYYEPQAVAAGMKVELRVQLMGIAIGVAGDNGVGALAHDLEVITQTDIMRLPVKASIVTRTTFEQLRLQPAASPNVREMFCADASLMKLGVRDLRRSNADQCRADISVE